MTIILASNNKGKIKEIKALVPEYEVIGFGTILGDLDIPETGSTFAENALIKAQTIYDLLHAKYSDLIVIADDSGLSVEALDLRPNIYSARFAGEYATDTQNNEKLIYELHSLGLNESVAFYTASIVAIINGVPYTTHGWCHGKVITTPRGTNGFGYDPLFIPEGYTQTFGELDIQTKKKLSHRTQALKLAFVCMKILK